MVDVPTVFLHRHFFLITKFYVDICAKHTFKNLKILISILIVIWDKFFQYFNFTCEKIEVEREVSNIPKIAILYGRVRI